MVRPHLFESAGFLLLAATTALPAAPTSPFRRENLRLAIVLLYATGLRLGELVRLTLGDYASHEHTLLSRDSKFHKSRCKRARSRPIEYLEFDELQDW